jgi:hypothetical protein
MTRSGRWKRAGRVGAILVLGILSGCGQAEPYATLGEEPLRRRWLEPCESDDDCPRSGECVNALCTMRCDQETLETCASLSSDAVCDTSLGACDVPCGVALACRVLASGYACEQNRCRAPEAVIVLLAR